MLENHCICGAPLFEADQITYQLGQDLGRHFRGDALGLSLAAGLLLTYTRRGWAPHEMFYTSNRQRGRYAAVSVPEEAADGQLRWLIALASALRLSGVETSFVYRGGGDAPRDLEDDIWHAEEFASGFVGWHPEWAVPERVPLPLWARDLDGVNLDPQSSPPIKAAARKGTIFDRLAHEGHLAELRDEMAPLMPLRERGVSFLMIRRLWSAGLRSLEEVLNAPDEALLGIHAVGPARAAAFRRAAAAALGVERSDQEEA